MNKFLMLLAVSAGLTLVEFIMLYFARTKPGWIPFKLRVTPDFEL